MLGENKKILPILAKPKKTKHILTFLEIILQYLAE